MPVTGDARAFASGAVRELCGLAASVTPGTDCKGLMPLLLRLLTQLVRRGQQSSGSSSSAVGTTHTTCNTTSDTTSNTTCNDWAAVEVVPGESYGQLLDWVGACVQRLPAELAYALPASLAHTAEAEIAAALGRPLHEAEVDALEAAVAGGSGGV